jgi:hypothetical protein
MTGLKQEQDITLSSQPFEPGLQMKKRKTTHVTKNTNNQLPANFEEELKHLNDGMDVDVKREFCCCCS